MSFTRMVLLGHGDDELVMAAGHLFDRAPLPDAVTRFLSSDSHHLLIAYDEAAPVGFVSGVEVTQPDRGTEMFLYELAVADGHRRSGVGTALVRSLATLAAQRGCYGMWVETGEDNTAALATYAKAGGRPGASSVSLEWAFPAG